jgi:asparagine synthase (glutamine-hydrolysing)
MCGIFGVVGKVDAQAFERAALRLRHRGPDGFGTHHDAEHDVHLAHCRLAVIDLSENGRQPMTNEDGSIWITYNGEIYNHRMLKRQLEASGHRFRSQSDTEVILHAYEEWGPQCLLRLEGMFAFGLWDCGRGRLLLARDRIGIKPLYYCHSDGRFVFASEPKALLALPFVRREIYPPALINYLIYGYVSGGDSIWSQVQQVNPGEYLEIACPSLQVYRSIYWRLAPERERHGLGEDQAVDRLDALLSEVVRRHLVSDVPLGVFLSGGVDSTAVACGAAMVSDHVRTFSVGFGAFRDELPVARQTASLLGTEHSEQSVDEGVFAQALEVLDFLDEPLANDSVFPAYWLSRVTRRSVTVALSGDGGDELFAGYEWYAQMAACRRRKRLAFALNPLVRALGLSGTRLGKRSDRFELYRILQTPGFLLSDIRRLFPWLPGDAFPPTESTALLRAAPQWADGYRLWQSIDMQMFLPCSNLVYMDRASMANSLEVRVPLLDANIVEFALSLPESLCVRDGQRKHVLRALLAKYGMGHAAFRPKHGFSCPVGTYHDLRRQREDILGGQLVKQGLLDARELTVGPPLNTFTSFILWMLEQWYARFMVGSPCDGAPAAACPSGHGQGSFGAPDRMSAASLDRVRALPRADVLRGGSGSIAGETAQVREAG